LTRYMQRLDELESRLSLAFRERHEKTKVLFMALQSRIHTTNLQFLLNRDQALVPQLLARTVQGILAALKEHRHSLAVQLSSLNNLSPLAILSRGYGIVETFPGKRVVRRARDVSVGDSVKARVAEGELICVVQKTKSP
jgi:exodeoxyribonuclease VII large subunit